MKPGANPIVDALLTHAGSRPDRVAVADHQQRMTFGGLLAHVAPLAELLGERPAGEVAVAAVRDAIDTAIATLAALAVARPISVVSARRDAAGVGLQLRAVGATTFVAPQTLLAQDHSVDQFVYPSPGRSSGRGTLPTRPLSLEDIAILATTSGSTGDPKLVPRLVRSTLAEPFDPTDVLAHHPDDVLLRAFFAGGGTARAVLRSVSAGTTLFCVDPLAVPVSRILRMLRQEHVTFARMVPSVLRRLLGQAPTRGGLPDLRLLASGGEPLRWDDVRLARHHMHPGSAIVHTYGSTEVSGIAARIIAFDEPLGAGIVPVGRPRTGRRVWIADGSGSPVGPDVLGRVVIEGDLGGSGPLFENLPDGLQRFRSDDRGCLDVAGELHLAGRSDGVIKIGAVRVDVAAVEDAVRAAPGVREAAVTPVGGSDRPALVAHVALDGRTGEPSGDPAAAERVRAIREHLLAVLESAAVPARIVVHSTGLPLLPSGKVDRRSLGSQ
jgi:acyl-coenzyme A synthetase/AMP-(fatty) acid ligase